MSRLLERGARATVHALVSRLKTGRLTVVEGDRRVVYGSGTPQATVVVHSPAVWPTLARGGRGMAEAYVDGLWDSPDLPAVIELAARNMRPIDDVRRRLSPAIEPLRRARALLTPSTPERSRRDIAAHYDLGNEMFELMLDPLMQYSSAVFERRESTLEEAQRTKLDRICDKLDLGPRDHLLEIGTGWGGLAVHAARTRGCRVTTTTLSREQHALAVRRAREAGVEGRVTVLLEDYRELQGTFDKLVSVEMIEAVGWRDFGTFFARCSQLLDPAGVMLLQAITVDDRLFDVEKASRTFIREHIFPNGCLPSLEVIARSVAHDTDLRMVDLEDITPHYAETLRRWRANIESSAAALAALGYDERFQRLWRLYLCWCEAGFEERRIGNVQLVLGKPRWRGTVASRRAGASAEVREATASA
ncbi:MAG TPA: cyclopropane-fatty-acyl-phospholipid synthase family protein [Solirubrobacteraceae bacterium]|nr:cyclopropane-fatty-acyl-phospholipid synthase family protein [Solirubrobacteraceae bacterium]